MGVETVVRATEDGQMATPLTNFQRCEAEGDECGAVPPTERRGWNQWYGGIPRRQQRSSGSCECGKGGGNSLLRHAGDISSMSCRVVG